MTNLEIINLFRDEIEFHLVDNLDLYPHIFMTDSHPCIYEFIKIHFFKTGYLLDIKDAADAIEVELGCEDTPNCLRYLKETALKDLEF